MYSPKSLSIKNIISYQDSYYEFNNNSATIIVGNNLDNPSQKVNGAGKSGLIESLALAFTGSSIRDVKGKELVRRGEKSGEVELVLSNSQTKKDLKIWRRIYSGTKSGECRVWLGDEEVRLSDINSYNKYIFDIIGLSKEDFFNFYLLTQANYSPFLRVGDTKKKEIINRFSGADIIDQTIPLVKLDCEQFEQNIIDQKTSITREEVGIEMLEKQLLSLKEKEQSVDQEKQDQINNSKLVQQTIEKEIETIKNQIDQESQNKEELQKQYDKACYEQLEQNFQDELQDCLKEKERLSKDIEGLEQASKQIADSFKAQYNEIESQLQETKEIRIQLTQDLKENSHLNATYKKSLLGKIECPNCHFNFVVKSELSYEQLVEKEKETQAIINQAESDLKSLEEVMEVLNQEKHNIDNQVAEKQKQNREDIAILHQNLNEIVKDQTKLQQEIADVQNSRKSHSFRINACQDKVNNLNQNLAVIESRLQEEKKKEQSFQSLSYKNDIETCQKEITSKQSNLKQLKSQLDQINEDYQKVAEWEVNFKNFKSFVANQSIKNIEDYTNIFLQQMGSDLGIILDGYSTLASGKIKEQISVEVTRRGFEEGSYGSFSGGERGRIDICVILAIQQLINLNCKGGGLDLLICDEILDQIDVVGLESIINSLQNLDRTIMVVSQNEINSLKEHTLMIEKKNKISKFVL